MNDELRRIRKEAAMAKSRYCILILQRDIKEIYDKVQQELPVS
jgi:hypothetical protein